MPVLQVDPALFELRKLESEWNYFEDSKVVKFDGYMEVYPSNWREEPFEEPMLQSIVEEDEELEANSAV